MKQKLDKEKEVMKREEGDLRSAINRLDVDKQHDEKMGKNLQAQILEVQAKYDECHRFYGDYENNKKKMSSENTDLMRQLEDIEAQINAMSKVNVQYGAQLEDIKRAADVENRDRVTILNKYRNLEHDFEGLQEQINEDLESKHALGRDLARASAEASMYRSKYENEGLARAEELEACALKLSCHLEEAEQQIESLKYKNHGLEKIKARISSELEAMHKDTEHSQALAAAAEKKQRQFEKVVGEWKLKVDELAHDLAVSQKESRDMSAELFKMKAQYDEGLEHVNGIRMENKSLGEEVKDYMDQLCEGSKNLNDLAKTVKKFEMEKDDLQGCLEEAEIALETAESKVLRGQLELSQVKQDIERKVQEKEEEFEATRKIQLTAMENMQASLEAEARAKAEALRSKVKLESEINDLEIILDSANKANSDISMTIKKIHLEMKDMQDRYAEEQRLSGEYREQFSVAERRANSLHAEVEESRTLLEQSDRGRRQTEADLSDMQEQYQTLYNTNNALSTTKRKLESDYQTMSADLNDMVQEAKASEDKAKKAMVDAARLADELRAEQESSANLAKHKKILECQTRDLQLKLEEAETVALKEGKKACAKLEGRITELEGQYNEESNKHTESLKTLRKCERRIKELTFQSEEDKKNHEKMQELVDKLQQKVKTYKRQIEEAEEIAAVNLAKYRKSQGDLEVLP